jgi:beta-fructofuranosidase
VATHQIVLATTRSSLSADAGGGIYQCALKLNPGEPLGLTVFLDGSVVEVFANGRTCLTGRIYPTSSQSLGVGIFAREGRAQVKSMDAYDMKAISPNRLSA